MNLPLHIARRYLLSKKSHNAINIISMISVCGIALATIALVCTLSVFNGFTDVVTKTFSNFDPALQITAKQGKVFEATDSLLLALNELPEVELVGESLIENALLKFEDRQEPFTLKGVSPNFQDLADINSLIIDGEFELRSGDFDFGIMGIGLASHMGTRAGFINALEIYIPKRNEKINMANPASTFTRADAYVSGVFALNQAEYDEEMFIVSIDLVRQLLRYENEVTSLDIKLAKGASINGTKAKIAKIVGNQFAVKDQFEQHETHYKWVNIEKWMTFLILVVISMMAIFNVVGSLSMLIMEKTDDIRILQSMGASNKLISNIFLYEGWLITFVGSMVGLIIGLAICYIQIHFGLLKIGDAGTFVVDSYPIVTKFSDVALIFITVNILGFIAVMYPIQNLKNKLKSEQLKK